MGHFLGIGLIGLDENTLEIDQQVLVAQRDTENRRGAISPATVRTTAMAFPSPIASYLSFGETGAAVVHPTLSSATWHRIN